MNKNPDLQFRYAKGLGDIIACILHSKALSWLTVLITGQKEPCKICSIRRDALNVLFPIPLWKTFFKSEKEALLSYKDMTIKNGSTITVNDSNTSAITFNGTAEILPITPNKITTLEEINNKKNIKNYICISDSDNFSGDLLIKVQIYKKVI
jgi:hypothetical protein